MNKEQAEIITEAARREAIALSNQKYRYKIKLFIERMRLQKRSEKVIKQAVKKKFKIILTDNG